MDTESGWTTYLDPSSSLESSSSSDNSAESMARHSISAQEAAQGTSQYGGKCKGCEGAGCMIREKRKAASSASASPSSSSSSSSSSLLPDSSTVSDASSGPRPEACRSPVVKRPRRELHHRLQNRQRDLEDTANSHKAALDAAVLHRFKVLRALIPCLKELKKEPNEEEMLKVVVQYVRALECKVELLRDLLAKSTTLLPLR